MPSTPPSTRRPAEPPAPATRPPGTPPPAASAGLRSGVVADECLLDAAEFAALLGRPVSAPEQRVLRRDGTTTTSSCVVHGVDGPPEPLGAINVYTVAPGTPAEFVRASGGRALSGVGRAAAVLATDAGPVLRVAGDRHLVTIAVMAGEPSDGAWRRAATAALARLPGS